MDTQAYLTEFCPAEIASIVDTADLLAPGDNDVYYRLEEIGVAPQCEVAATLHLAGQVTPATADAVLTSFFKSVASLADLIPETGRETVTTSLRQFEPNALYGADLITALRRLRYDDRARLRPFIPVNWTFSEPRDEAALPWHFALYAASLGDLEALDRMADKIAATTDPDATVALLESLSVLDHPRVTEILRRYDGDSRRTRGANGPDLMVREFVADMLEDR